MRTLRTFEAFFRNSPKKTIIEKVLIWRPKVRKVRTLLKPAQAPSPVVKRNAQDGALVRRHLVAPISQAAGQPRLRQGMMPVGLAPSLVAKIEVYPRLSEAWASGALLPDPFSDDVLFVTVGGRGLLDSRGRVQAIRLPIP